MADLARVLDAFDEAVAAAAPIVDESVVRDAALVADRARRRIGFLGRSVVVALVGGTGSGKSSLLNALAGTEVATTGVLRPTTQTALAWLPRAPEPGLTRLLDSIGVVGRVGHDLSTPVCVLDMPDVDSVAGSHRDEVERLLPQVDSVIWVLDPEKYNDRVVHEDFLQHLAAYEHQFVFVLNQIDRIYGPDRQIIVDDLLRQLRDDGFTDPTVLTTAAAPDVGDPIGIAALWSHLGTLVEDKRLVSDKLLADVSGATHTLEAAAGFDRDVDWSTLWTEARDRSADSLAAAALSAEARRAFEVAGRSAALGRHPVGLLGAVRRRRLGRALAIGHGSVEKLRSWPTNAGAGTARGTLSELLGSVIARLRGRTGQTLAERFDDTWIDEQVASAMDRTLRNIEPDSPTPSAAGLVGWLGLLAVTVGGGWWWSVPPERGEVPWHLILIGGGVLVMAVSRWIIGSLADRATRRALARLREQLVGEIRRHLDGLVGSPVSRELRGRAELRAALAAVSVAAASRKESR